MKKHLNTSNKTRRFACVLLCVVMAAAALLPVFAGARGANKTVRVGWFESPFNMTDQFGGRSGYGYQYQQKIAAYTGWNYEYVEGSWPELLEMLAEGKIDLMSDVSFTEERAEKMLFPSLPMGTEEYILFVAQDNTELTLADYSSFDNKKIGVNKGSIMIGMYEEWARIHGVNARLVEMTGSETDSMNKVKDGELDGYISVDSYGDEKTVSPLCTIGSSDFYFAVSKSRPDLLSDLENALSSIQSENRYYNYEMYDKYVKTSGANLFATSDEISWLTAHGSVRVGYLDNYLAFCAADENGELTGALKEYLALASDCMENVHIDFQPVAYGTALEAMDALLKGEIDCFFPVNMPESDAENAGVVMTPTLMQTEVYAVVRREDSSKFSHMTEARVAVNAGDTNTEAFLRKYYPDWRLVYFDNTSECLAGIAGGNADCMMISNYRYNNLGKTLERYGLDTVSTGVDANFGFAVKRGDSTLYSLLARTTRLVSESSVNAALSYYIAKDAKGTLSDFLRANMGSVVLIIVAVAALVVGLLLKSLIAEKKANKKQKLISATENDPLTGLYTRGFFLEYSAQIYRLHPEKHMDAVVLNIEQFHSINEFFGRDFGDEVLRALGGEMRDFLGDSGGIGARFMADHFEMYCLPQEDYQELLDRLQGRLNSFSRNASVRLRMGVMPHKEGMDPVQLFDRAQAACGKLRGSGEHLIVYDETMEKTELLRQRLRHDLNRAIRDGELKVYYQPKYDITGERPKLTSAEALVRWRHPDLGMVSPSDFIPLFERSGEICKIDRYVWRETARQIAKWRDKYGVTLPISVNLSRVDAMETTLTKTLEDLVAEYKIDGSILRLEVTESAYTENTGLVIKVVNELREKGFKIEMDDFGSGYSTLSTLTSMPIDIIKMDIAFIRNLEKSEKDVRMLRSVLEIAESLKVPVVAEGVETEEQYLILKNAGCPYVQGFYFSRPLPADEFEATILGELI